MDQTSNVVRIIDVNTNRAMEGIRVVEEIARFVLEDEALTKRIKTLRQKIKSAAGSANDIRCRDAKKDAGKKLYPESEGARENLFDIFKSNVKRAEEAARCLEEFSKLLDRSFGKKFKAIRFELYELEKEIEIRLSKFLKLDFSLYLVTDPMRDPVKVVKEAVKGGIKIVQLRDKYASKSKYLKLAKKIRKITRASGVTFIVNDFVNVAKQVDADGVHLGQGDGSPQTARKILGAGKLIGVSTHNLAEALKAQSAGADYIAVGNIFETPSKPGKKGIGIGKLKAISKKLKIPVVAIGGINAGNIHEIRNAGVSRAAVIRAVAGSKNIKQSIRQFEG